LADPVDAESSAVIRARVDRARDIQRERFGVAATVCNAHMTTRQMRRFCKLDNDGQQLMEMVTDRLGYSARTYTRILKVARTIADLTGSEQILQPHLAEAIQYRSLDRKMA
jgi:magnesium chelatase family protein